MYNNNNNKRMARSRVEKIRTIFERMNGLINAGAVMYKDRPLWFDVYEAFPPKRAPKHDQIIPDQNVRPILYAEDLVRAKLGHTNDESVDLKTPGDLASEKFIQKYAELQISAPPGTDVFKQTKKELDWGTHKLTASMKEKKMELLRQMMEKAKPKYIFEEVNDILNEEMLEELLKVEEVEVDETETENVKANSNGVVAEGSEAVGDDTTFKS